jgi:formylglycine-generating enzyme required for sulfatase activity
MPEFFAYCRWLGEHEVADDAQAINSSNTEGIYVVDVRALGYRMPLDNEWQRAVRAGTSTSRYFGEGAEQVAAQYVQGLAGGARAADVATKMPNQLGLFDALGNVHEWTLDEVNEDGELIVGPAELVRRIEILGNNVGTRLRVVGGSFRQAEASLKADSAFRFFAQSSGFDVFGFRVARTIQMPSERQHAAAVNGDEEPATQSRY